jgi:protein-tyrosine-phosphatase
MAAALFKQTVESRSDAGQWRIDSAGIWAEDGLPASRLGQEVMGVRGFDLTKHRARQVTVEELKSYDLILVMERRHKDILKTISPELAECIYLLSEMIGTVYDIRDPFGGEVADYKETAQEFERIFIQGYDRICKLVMTSRCGEKS